MSTGALGAMGGVYGGVLGTVAGDQLKGKAKTLFSAKAANKAADLRKVADLARFAKDYDAYDEYKSASRKAARSVPKLLKGDRLAKLGRNVGIVVGAGLGIKLGYELSKEARKKEEAIAKAQRDEKIAMARILGGKK